MAHLRKDGRGSRRCWAAAGRSIVPIHESRNLLSRTDAGYDAVFLDAAAVLRDPCAAPRT